MGGNKMNNEAYKYVMRKYAGLANIVGTLSTVAGGVGTLASGIMMGKAYLAKLNNDTRRRAIIEDLARNDAILRQVPKDKLISWYGVIFQYSPRTSLNKEVTRDLLQSFARIGKVDLQTVKTLAETEKAVVGGIADSARAGGTFSWGR